MLACSKLYVCFCLGVFVLVFLFLFFFYHGLKYKIFQILSATFCPFCSCFRYFLSLSVADAHVCLSLALAQDGGLWLIQLMQKMAGFLGSLSRLMLGAHGLWASLRGTWQQPWPFSPNHMGVGAELAPSNRISTCLNWWLSYLEPLMCSGNMKSFLANVVTCPFKWDLKISPLYA